MRLHNSTDINQSIYHTDRKFIIRYQENYHNSHSNRHKSRSITNQDKNSPRMFMLSESDAYQQDKILQQKQLQKINQSSITQRSRRRQSVRSPQKLTGLDLTNSINLNYSALNPPIEQERDFPRIPIQYNDERVNGLAADFLRLKVIYRGYAPKNTYYYLKSIAFNSVPIKPNTKRGQYQLQFESKFQSGNLAAVARKSAKQFYLFMRQDTNSYGLRQWYYYSVSNKKAGRYKFRIYKFSKFYSLYKQGMKPFSHNILQPVTQWRQCGQNIKYQYDSDTKSHFLQFQYEFVNDGETIQFATQPPYTYSMMKKFLKSLMDKYPTIKILKAGQSLSGLDIPRIQIVGNDLKIKKKAIVILARTHPGQTASNWSVQAIVDKIYQLSDLRSYYDFYIMPMVNPDGVYLGNHRTGVMGQDLNRNFTSINIQLFPEVEVVQKLIQNLQKQKQIQFLFDLHGHSARRNIFAYGDEHEIGSYSFLMSHIIPKILDESISSFKYSYCIFKGSKQKKNTARVYLSKKYKLNAITFQQSYGLLDEGAIGIQHWKNFGIALIASLQTFYNLVMGKGMSGVADYLSVQIANQRQRFQKELQKKIPYIEVLKTELTQKQIGSGQKLKTESNSQKKEKTQKMLNAQQIQEVEKDSQNSSELDSGDQDLQNNEQGMEIIKKQLIRIGCLKEVKRQFFKVAERNLQIRSHYEPRLHQQRFSMASRILKFQMKKKDELITKFHQQKAKLKLLNITQKVQRHSFQLPNLKK